MAITIGYIIFTSTYTFIILLKSLKTDFICVTTVQFKNIYKVKFDDPLLLFHYLYYISFHSSIFVLMSFDTEHKTIQMEEAASHDQLALDALERRRVALEEVLINISIFKDGSLFLNTSITDR